MTSDVEKLLALYDTRLRGHVPEVPPVGAVIEQDGPLIRTHYGTHGSIDCRRLPPAGLDELIARQRDAFEARSERGEWKVYAHDAPADLPDRLRGGRLHPRMGARTARRLPRPGHRRRTGLKVGNSRPHRPARPRWQP